jgi:hypothetical protein
MVAVLGSRKLNLDHATRHDIPQVNNIGVLEAIERRNAEDNFVVVVIKQLAR